MKRFLLAIAAVVALSAAAEASVTNYRYRSAYQAPVATNYGYAPSYGYTYNRGYNYGYSRGNGPFARLMELERRKNAMLRRTFFGY
jgi:hypothetical protein